MTKNHRTSFFEKRIIQVAGVIDEDDARLVAGCGVDLIGLPLDLMHGDAEITAETAGRIVRTLPPPARGVLITYLSLAGAIVSRCEELGVSMVQLHGNVPLEELVRLRRAAPTLLVVKTVAVGSKNVSQLMDEVARLSPHVDAFLTDTFDPVTGRWGATGKTHDWSISRRILDRSPRPVILAGGLTPHNVRQAILDVGPAGVDVHTGVEDETGRKDRRLVQEFVEASRWAFESIRPPSRGPGLGGPEPG